MNRQKDSIQKKKKVLKHSKTGLETEFHLIDSQTGKISSRATEAIAHITGLDKNIIITTEIGRNMIELGCFPDVPAYSPILDMVESLIKTHDACESMGLSLYPFATYPGKFKPLITNIEKYRLKEKIMGKKTDILCRVTGFHHHYSLPKGVFDYKTRSIRLMRRSKLKRTMVSSYNLEIAADPALTLLAQSSPFYEGRQLGKDSRMIVYRGGRKLNYPDGAYADLQQIGGLPPYKQTLTDLMQSYDRRIQTWEKIISRIKPRIKLSDLYSNRLDIGWNPVKLNKHGTLEERGMDVNFLSVLTAITALLKFPLREIQREYIEVMPADFAIREPFKLEGNILYIPPHSHVRNKLQNWSAYEGFSRPQMHDYTRRFFRFARSFAPKRYYRALRPLSDMIDEKKSVSDRIIKYANNKGYLKDGKISNEDAASLALHYAGRFRKDLELTYGVFEKLSSI